ncbi:hypothetical protein PGSY75_1303300 [Plasmodium gaboni]|uniref:Uncharacterized protein n=1 Tax=Plasmodium gaboni TaxID=647221 RepID=A0A151LD96_9APIC|nr:hypothetical protein PGSY75_1303300 [Plasmodium gaboni]KYN96836.1 hypothetical protein PGSY75_1303300 [Plasmodium gaboni]SOV17186.1 conserved Plasmodium protein, unknown function [Plasmodium gaboni]
MLFCSKNSEETYHNVINSLLYEIKNLKLDDKYYFLIKQKQLHCPLFSLCKLNFREDPIIVNINKDTKEDEAFNLIYHNKKILDKKKKKKKKEEELIKNLTTGDNIIQDEELIDKLSSLLKLNHDTNIIIDNEKNYDSLYKYYSFYDDAFNTSLYYIQDDYDLLLNKHVNGLYILSISKYSNILKNILSDIINNINNDEYNLKDLIKQYVQIIYDPRLINADTSGKRKTKTIFINDDMTILNIIYKNNIYKIKSKIKGYHYDINNNIIYNPYLLFYNTQDEGWLIIIKNKNTDLTKFIETTDYYDKKKLSIEQYDELIKKKKKTKKETNL